MTPSQSLPHRQPRPRRREFLWLLGVGAASWFSSIPLAAQERSFDLRPHWDDQAALANPHKGWYHHYPDNHIDKYRIAQAADLLRFPGMDHVYIRLAWAYLEPKEGEFHWPVIDSIIEKWTAHGLGIAFRISCRETSTDRPEQQYATLEMLWENRGVAPAYQPYSLRFRLEGSETVNFEVPAGNQRWLPKPAGPTFLEAYRIAVPSAVKPGAYLLKFRLRSHEAQRDVRVALRPDLLDSEGFYRLGTIEVRE